MAIAEMLKSINALVIKKQSSQRERFENINIIPTQFDLTICAKIKNKTSHNDFSLAIMKYTIIKESRINNE